MSTKTKCLLQLICVKLTTELRKYRFRNGFSHEEQYHFYWDSKGRDNYVCVCVITYHITTVSDFYTHLLCVCVSCMCKRVEIGVKRVEVFPLTCGSQESNPDPQVWLTSLVAVFIYPLLTRGWG